VSELEPTSRMVWKKAESLAGSAWSGA